MEMSMMQLKNGLSLYKRFVPLTSKYFVDEKIDESQNYDNDILHALRVIKSGWCPDSRTPSINAQCQSKSCGMVTLFPR